MPHVNAYDERMWQRKERCSVLMEDHEMNAFHDEADYDHVLYPHDVISDGNSLHDAYLLARKQSDWKTKVRMFDMHWLHNLSNLQYDIDMRQYHTSKTNQLVLKERGKIRVIEGQQVRDRIVEHSLCDNVVSPTIRPYLIYNNSSSIKGRGVSFARKELVKDLVEYYNATGSNEGYILLMDFRKYYDNIIHEKLRKQFGKLIDLDSALYLIDVLLKSFEVDVSYLDEEDFNNCLNDIFVMLDYIKIKPELKTGEKFMKKHMNIGNQLSQNAGILYASPLDNYIEIVQGFRWHARYSDDSYVINRSRSKLEHLLTDLERLTPEWGVHLNMKKTRIVKLSSNWKFLQMTYSLCDSGRIMQKINTDRLSSMRAKMKKLSTKMTTKEFTDWYNGWYQSYKKYMSRRQKENMNLLFSDLVTKTLKEDTQNENHRCRWYEYRESGTEWRLLCQ